MHTTMAVVADLIATTTEIGVATASQRHGIIIQATTKVKLTSSIALILFFSNFLSLINGMR